VSAPLATFSLSRCFSITSPALDWLTPKFQEKSKSPKGRPHVATGGSTRGTTVVWGDFGLRMKDHDRRMPASALKIAEETIKRRLRGMNYKLYKRVSANIGVYTKGNEQRMGKGKGKFDYWTVRLPVSRVVFELKGDVHEKVAREAFRLAGHKLPGMRWIGYNLLEYVYGLMLICFVRSLGICQQGRPPCCRYYKARKRRDSRLAQAGAQKPAPRYQ
jgi:ribosomal protein L16